MEPSFSLGLLPLLIPDALTAHIPRRLSLAFQSQDGRCLSFSHSSNRRLYQRLLLVFPALPPLGLPTGSKADAALAALVCLEHQALARMGFRVIVDWQEH